METVIMPQAFDGVRVLELGQIYNGPYCGLPNKYLSDPADAPETRIEKMFAELEPAFVGTDPATGAG